MKLDLWAIHSIMAIEWYSLTLELRLMILAINKVFNMKKMDFP